MLIERYLTIKTETYFFLLNNIISYFSVRVANKLYRLQIYNLIFIDLNIRISKWIFFQNWCQILPISTFPMTYNINELFLIYLCLKFPYTTCSLGTAKKIAESDPFLKLPHPKMNLYFLSLSSERNSCSTSSLNKTSSIKKHITTTFELLLFGNKILRYLWLPFQNNFFWHFQVNSSYWLTYDLRPFISTEKRKFWHIFRHLRLSLLALTQN